MIYLPETTGQIGFGEILDIDPRELERLLQKQALDRFASITTQAASILNHHRKGWARLVKQ